jgi:hypothetical protein
MAEDIAALLKCHATKDYDWSKEVAAIKAPMMIVCAEMPITRKIGGWAR